MDTYRYSVVINIHTMYVVAYGIVLVCNYWLGTVTRRCHIFLTWTNTLSPDCSFPSCKYEHVFYLCKITNCYQSSPQSNLLCTLK